MGIRLNYQPSAAATGQVALQAGQGEFNKYSREMGQRDTELAMRDQELIQRERMQGRSIAADLNSQKLGYAVQQQNLVYSTNNSNTMNLLNMANRTMNQIRSQQAAAAQQQAGLQHDAGKTQYLTQASIYKQNDQQAFQQQAQQQRFQQQGALNEQMADINWESRVQQTDEALYADRTSRESMQQKRGEMSEQMRLVDQDTSLRPWEKEEAKRQITEEFNGWMKSPTALQQPPTYAPINTFDAPDGSGPLMNDVTGQPQLWRFDTTTGEPIEPLTRQADDINQQKNSILERDVALREAQAAEVSALKQEEAAQKRQSTDLMSAMKALDADNKARLNSEDGTGTLDEEARQLLNQKVKSILSGNGDSGDRIPGGNTNQGGSGGGGLQAPPARPASPAANDGSGGGMVRNADGTWAGIKDRGGADITGAQRNNIKNQLDSMPVGDIFPSRGKYFQKTGPNAAIEVPKPGTPESVPAPTIDPTPVPGPGYNEAVAPQGQNRQGGVFNTSPMPQGIDTLQGGVFQHNNGWYMKTEDGGMVKLPANQGEKLSISKANTSLQDAFSDLDKGDILTDGDGNQYVKISPTQYIIIK